MKTFFLVATAMLTLSLALPVKATPTVLAEFKATHQVGTFLVRAHMDGTVTLEEQSRRGNSMKQVDTLDRTELTYLGAQINACVQPKLQLVKYAANMGSNIGYIKIFSNSKEILLKSVTRSNGNPLQSQMQVSDLACAKIIEDILSAYHSHRLPRQNPL